ncbi:nuclear transport factor 2 family protein [Flavobacterium humi]|uniref:SnoaL-like domain-containing protein n=1 Tax=Flavobacterium humi TaxID=2562683 RepID=A0A4Z0LAM4_9FLAO|nr:nuclear transport factor 2 family protein [Flavobacterium humi]TGD58742.1 hypothetical protein E4635_07450 [Flavobacterium humi]
MKKFTLLFALFISGIAFSQNKETASINTTLDAWHKAAAQAKFEAYFSLMADQSVFIGTDATENWDKPAFMAFAKPYFDKGKAWNFTPLERHIYFDASGKTAWFDELLDTQMKICRGSGVLVKEGNQWKIKHYVLSMTVPNDNSDAVVKIKTLLEDPLIQKLKK